VFTIPVSVLTSVLMVFGRMSHDGELTAMKACGISLWQAARSPLIGACLLSAVCLQMNFEIAPRIELRQRALMEQMRGDVMLSLLEEGQLKEMSPGIKVYIWRKKGNRLQNVIIMEQTKTLTRRIEARTATVALSPDNKYFKLDLFDVRISPFMEGNSASGFSERWPFTMPVQSKSKLDKSSPSSLTTQALGAELLRFDPVVGAEPNPLEHLRMMVEVNTRIVMALGCLAFVFIGIPLGIRNPRKESSFSIGISLLLAFAFYLFIIMALTVSRRPELAPHLFVWFPIPFSIILGVWLIRRLN
jgi:lipopolysaccharide export system permease protein